MTELTPEQEAQIAIIDAQKLLALRSYELTLLKLNEKIELIKNPPQQQ